GSGTGDGATATTGPAAVGDPAGISGAPAAISANEAGARPRLVAGTSAAGPACASSDRAGRSAAPGPSTAEGVIAGPATLMAVSEATGGPGTSVESRAYSMI